MALLEMAGNRWRAQIVTDLRKVMKLNRHHSLFKQGRLADSLAEHRALMAAIAARDAAARHAADAGAFRQRAGSRAPEPCSLGALQLRGQIAAVTFAPLARHSHPPEETRIEDPRIPGQGTAARSYGVPVPRGYAAFTVQRGGGSRAEARRQRLGRQGADPRRRPRQGRRRQARALASTRSRSWPARSWACSSRPTRPAPKARRCAACYIEEGADIKKEYYVAAAHRPRHAEGGHDRLQRRRHGHRGSGARHAREDHHGLRRPARRPDRCAGAGRWPPASACPPPASAQAVDVLQEALQPATWTPTPRWPRSTR